MLDFRVQFRAKKNDNDGEPYRNWSVRLLRTDESAKANERGRLLEHLELEQAEALPLSR